MFSYFLVHPKQSALVRQKGPANYTNFGSGSLSLRRIDRLMTANAVSLRSSMNNVAKQNHFPLLFNDVRFYSHKYIRDPISSAHQSRP